MKKLLIFTVAIIIAISQLPGIASAARPKYPWRSDYPYALPLNTSRHHIIPWEELVRYGFETYTTQYELTVFFSNYSGINQANLGQYKNINDLVQAFLQGQADALETMRELFAWMQGNLVVGPTNRQHDPGEAFDSFALACRQQKYPNPDYNNLQARWNGTPSEEKGVFTILSKTPMSGDQTINCIGW